MTRRLDDFASSVDGLPAHHNQPRPPQGWEPGHTYNLEDGIGTYTGLSLEQSIDPDEAKILEEMGLDPEQWQVVPGSLQVRKWQQKAGTDDWCWYYRITVERRTDTVDIAEFTAAVRSRKPRKPPTKLTPAAQLWCSSDHQVGKPGTAERLDAMLTLPLRFRAAHKAAGRPEHVVTVWGGDHGEGCRASYGGIAYQVELHERDQRRVFREIALAVIDEAAAVATRVTVVVVGGNHGEVRETRGNLATDVSDNRDVAMIEDVAFACRGVERYAHVEWLIPDEELTVCFEAGGVNVGVAHGHQIGGRSGSGIIEKWWDAQAGNHRPIGAADLLITGHRHHFQHVWLGPRTWIQLPAEDNGSPGFAERYGTGDARPGSVTVDLADGTIGNVRII
jgi:predicted phosphodiesterase